MDDETGIDVSGIGPTGTALRTASPLEIVRLLTAREFSGLIGVVEDILAS